MNWDDAMIESLKTLWESDLSTAAIGRELGVSKNSVCGKAFRLGLASRASPVRTKGSSRTKPQKNRVKDCRIFSVVDLRANMCRWPEGHPDQDGFNFCAKPVVQGKPYCEAHCAIAYTPKSSSREKTGVI